MQYLACLLGSFEEQRVDQQVRSNQQSLLFRCSTLREFNFHKVCLIVNIAELFLGNLGHATNVRRITVSSRLVGRVDAARNQAAAKRTAMSFHTEINAHTTQASRGMDLVNCIIILVIDLPLRNTVLSQRVCENKMVHREH